MFQLIVVILAIVFVLVLAWLVLGVRVPIEAFRPPVRRRRYVRTTPVQPPASRRVRRTIIEEEVPTQVTSYDNLIDPGDD